MHSVKLQAGTCHMLDSMLTVWPMLLALFLEEFRL